MERKSFRVILILAFAAVFVIQACKKDEEPEETQPQEFVADNSTFSGFMSWPLEATNQGPDPALGASFPGNDLTVIRDIYFKNGQDPVNGMYPKGTVIVKHSSNPAVTVNEFKGMVKRGEGFNTSGNGWEWFILNPDGTIAVDDDGNPLRGANLADGDCTSCHEAASAKDYVYSK
jgi:hypothetical protein